MAALVADVLLVELKLCGELAGELRDVADVADVAIASLSRLSRGSYGPRWRLQQPPQRFSRYALATMGKG